MCTACLHKGHRWLAVHIRKLTVGRRMPSLSDGAIHRSSGSVLQKEVATTICTITLQKESPNLIFSRLPHTQVGPHAVNLAGGQAASMRIAKDILRRQQQKNVEVSELSGKSKTEEYIQQMQGLLWL